MARTTTFRVINNRFLFRCSSCGAKRRLSVSPNIRQKNVRCFKCEELNRCAFNRRVTPREQQSGQAVLITSAGKEVDIHLVDISSKGVGVELSIQGLRSRAVKIGDQIQLVCGWNPRLFSGRRFIVQNIREQKVGIKILEVGSFV